MVCQCHYLFELADLFSDFYEACPVLRAEGAERAGRLVMCDVTGRTLKLGVSAAGDRSAAADVTERAGMSISSAPDGQMANVLARARDLFPLLHSLHEDLDVYVPDLVSIAGVEVLDEVAEVVEVVAKHLTRRTGSETLVSRAEGSVNKQTLTVLVGRASALTHLGDDPIATTSRLVRKVILHAAVPYDDITYAARLAHSSCRALTAAASLSKLPPVVETWLVGSMADPAERAWHPTLSDIDLFPMVSRPPNPAERGTIRHVYKRMSNPPTDYLNLGAKAGIGGLRRDPLLSLCVAKQRLLPEERLYRAGLLSGARRVRVETGAAMSCLAEEV